MDEVLQTKLNFFLYYVLLKSSPIFPNPPPSHSSLPVKIKPYDKTAFFITFRKKDAHFPPVFHVFFHVFLGVKIKSYKIMAERNRGVEEKKRKEFRGKIEKRWTGWFRFPENMIRLLLKNLIGL
jgi:hypothetical protein